MKRASRGFPGCVIVLALLAAAALVACESQTGPDAPPRESGCIDTTCAPVNTAKPPGSTPPADAGPG